MKSNLEIIKEKVIEVVPEILELKFGCKINGNGLHLAQVIWKSSNTLLVLRGGSHKVESVQTDDTNLEIIGRPIQLSDVLRAIDTVKDKGIDITTYGEFIDNNKNEYARMTDIRWNLSKPLEEQSEEVLEFLVQLLDNK